ncbi:MAG: hypothetical protein UX33_C0004G0001, partial [Candidatus Azambacteria bacterium GW2011_GWC1_46_13]
RGPREKGGGDVHGRGILKKTDGRDVVVVRKAVKINY